MRSAKTCPLFTANCQNHVEVALEKCDIVDLWQLAEKRDLLGHPKMSHLQTAYFLLPQRIQIRIQVIKKILMEEPDLIVNL
jgi:hypothetical protein